MPLFFFCNQCNRKYKRADRLVQHQQKAHGVQNPVVPAPKDFGTIIPKIIEPSSEAKDGEECKVCMEKNPDTAFVPCGHCITCSMCADILIKTTRKCPYCRTYIQTSMRIYT